MRTEKLMKVLKQSIALLIALCLTLGLLTACGGTGISDPSEDVKTSTENASKDAEETAAPGQETQAPGPDTSSMVDIVGSVKLDLESETKKLETTVHLFVDGDTTHFNVSEDIAESGILKARYLGINTPESTGVIEKWGKQASNFTKEKLSHATSIYVESDDANWNFDNTTSHRCLLWVWYQPEEGADYRNLNLELLQEGLAIANNSAQNRYGEYAVQCIDQAKKLKLHVYSNEKDPLFYEGESREVTLKAIRTNPEAYVGISVSFEAVIAREYSNTLYVEDFDDDDGIYYGITVYYGYSMDPDALNFMQIGNRVKFVGSVQYYEAGGTYQISGLKYNVRKPEESCQLVEEGYKINYVETAPKTFNQEKLDIIVTMTSESGETLEVPKAYDYAELAMSTTLEMKNLTVTSIYTTTNDASSSKGAMTLTCRAQNGSYVNVRTVVLKDDGGNLITESAYAGKTINVRGIVDYYDGSYQIKVFTADDITVL